MSQLIHPKSVLVVSIDLHLETKAPERRKQHSKCALFSVREIVHPFPGRASDYEKTDSGLGRTDRKNLRLALEVLERREMI